MTLNEHKQIVDILVENGIGHADCLWEGTEGIEIFGAGLRELVLFDNGTLIYRTESARLRGNILTDSEFLKKFVSFLKENFR